MTRYSIYKKLILKNQNSNKLNFNPDGRKHYVYRITDFTRNSEEHYYGSRTSKLKDILKDFWNYRTSSKYNKIIKENKEDYKVKIIKIFDNSGDKILYEAFIHQFFNVKLHNSFWNKSNQTPFGFDTTGLSHDGRITEEGIMKMKETKMRKIIIDGIETTSAKENARNAAKTMKIKDDNGLSIYEKSTIKGLSTKNKVFIKNGEETNILIEQGKSQSKTKNSKEWKKLVGNKSRAQQKDSLKKSVKKYNIMKDNEVIISNIIRKDIDKISASLLKKDIINYLGKSYQSFNVLKSKKFKGLYCEEIVSEEYFEGDILKELEKLL